MHCCTKGSLFILYRKWSKVVQMDVLWELLAGMIRRNSVITVTNYGLFSNLGKVLDSLNSTAVEVGKQNMSMIALYCSGFNS